MTTSAAPKQKGMCIATRCTSVDQFIEMFHRFVDEDSFFVSTINTRPPGLETSFSVQLADGTPVLRGLCVVLQAWSNATSPFKTPGVRLGIKRLTANSMPIFERLLVTRSAPPPPSPALAAGTPLPRRHTATAPIDNSQFAEAGPTNVVEAKVVSPPPERTPGSDLVLPANPLMNLSDASLEGYVDCTLYEETGTFFPVDDTGEPLDDDLVPPPSPPLLAPKPVTRRSAPVEIVADEPGSISAGSEDVSSERMVAPPVAATPLPTTPAPAKRPTPLPGLPPVPTRKSDPVLAPPSHPVAAGEISPPRGGPPENTASGEIDTGPVPITRESTPSGEIVTVTPAPRRRGGRILIAVAGAAIVAAGVWFVTHRGLHDDEIAAAPAPATKPAAVTPAPQPAEAAHVEQPVPTPAPPTDDTTDRASPDEPEGGAPMAGEGPCRVVIATTPAGSMVDLDGKAVAPSPITIATTCDKHKLDFTHPRYQMATRMVALKEGTPGSVSVTLQRPTHQVKITSQPAGATVFIDGLRAGTTPTVVSVMGFSNLKVELKKTGYAPISQKLYSKVAQDNLSVKLTKW